MSLPENHRTKYGLTSTRVHGNTLPLMAINDAHEAAAQIADRGHHAEVASQIRALKWEAEMPIYASAIRTVKSVV